MTVRWSSTAVRLPPSLSIKMYQVKKSIFAVKFKMSTIEAVEGFEEVGAGVKVPGVEVKFPCGACEARCVEQQVTPHSFCPPFKVLFLVFNTVNFKWHINLFKMEVGELQITNFFLSLECISGYSTPFGLWLPLAGTFFSPATRCPMRAESFPVTRNQPASSVWMLVWPKSWR